MSPCNRCENLPSPAFEAGRLYVAPPLSHTRSTLRRLLKRHGAAFEEVSEEVLSVELTPGVLKRLSSALAESLSTTELADSRALMIPEGTEFSVNELARMQSLEELVARVRGEWLVEILREGRLTTHFHPIVEASNPENIFAYECLLRGLGADGNTISPGPMFEVASSAGLLFNLDRDARITAIRKAAGHGIKDNLFINFNPTSIYDPVYCLQSTIKAFENTDLQPGQIVFELTESEKVDDTGQLLDIVDFYRDAGFGIALDDLGAGYSSLNLLTELKPDFMKLDIQLVSGVGSDPYKSQIAAKLLELAKDLGVATVAEGVETHKEWAWLRENGADYLQGFLFAHPGSPPPTPQVPQGLQTSDL